MKNKRNNSAGASWLQIASVVALILPAAILIASALQSALVDRSAGGTVRTAPAEFVPEGCIPSYTFAVAGRTFVSGVDDIGNHCDNCSTAIALPFQVTLYDQVYTMATAGSNGQLTFGAAYDNLCASSLLGGPVHHRMRHHGVYRMWHLYHHDRQCSQPHLLRGIPHAVL